MRLLCSHEYPVRLSFPRTGGIVSEWHSLEGEEFEGTLKPSSNSVLAQFWTCAGVSTYYQAYPISYQPCINSRIISIWRNNHSNISWTGQMIIYDLFPMTGVSLWLSRYVKKMLSLQINVWRFLLQLPSIKYYYYYYSSIQSKLWRCVIELLVGARKPKSVSALRPQSVSARKPEPVSTRKPSIVILRKHQV
jgi:hypothetical protein